jgi:hypothetical protein
MSRYSAASRRGLVVDAVLRNRSPQGLSLVTGRNTGRGDKTGLSCQPIRQENRGVSKAFQPDSLLDLTGRRRGGNREALKCLQGASGKTPFRARVRGTPSRSAALHFRIDHWTITTMQQSNNQIIELGQPILTNLERHSRNDLAESGGSRARWGTRKLRRICTRQACPSTRFPKLTDLREALVTGAAQAGASVEGAP